MCIRRISVATFTHCFTKDVGPGNLLNRFAATDHFSRLSMIILFTSLLSCWWREFKRQAFLVHDSLKKFKIASSDRSPLDPSGLCENVSQRCKTQVHAALLDNFNASKACKDKRKLLLGEFIGVQNHVH